MNAASWVRLLQSVPLEERNNVFLMTQGGQEVAIQSIAKFTHDFLVIRGRLSGTTDDNRVFLVPLDTITYAGFQRPVRPNTLTAMFGELDVELQPNRSALPIEESTLSATPAAQPSPKDPTPVPADGSAATSQRGKSILLNWRAKHQAGGAGPASTGPATRPQ